MTTLIYIVIVGKKYNVAYTFTRVCYVLVCVCVCVCVLCIDVYVYAYPSVRPCCLSVYLHAVCFDTRMYADVQTYVFNLSISLFVY